MKLTVNNKFHMIWTIIVILFVILSYNNDYMEFKMRKCIVLEKMETSGGKRSGGNYYLVLKEERGIVFDQIVSPTTYFLAEKGKPIFLSLRQMDIQQTLKDNIIYFFGTAILLAFIIIGFIYLIIIKVTNQYEN